MYNSENKTKCDLGLGFSGTRSCDFEWVVSDVPKASSAYSRWETAHPKTQRYILGIVNRQKHGRGNLNPRKIYPITRHKDTEGRRE
jgi:hypothetical protein